MLFHLLSGRQSFLSILGDKAKCVSEYGGLVCLCQLKGSGLKACCCYGHLRVSQSVSFHTGLFFTLHGPHSLPPTFQKHSRPCLLLSCQPRLPLRESRLILPGLCYDCLCLSPASSVEAWRRNLQGGGDDHRSQLFRTCPTACKRWHPEAGKCGFHSRGTLWIYVDGKGHIDAAQGAYACFSVSIE